MYARRWVALILLAFVFSACSWFDDPSPDSIRVQLEGTAGDSLTLITSTEFFATTNEAGQVGVQIFVSDTLQVTLPYDETWDIRGDQRFFMLGTPADTLSPGVMVRLRVNLDSDEALDRQVNAVIENPLQFVYLFNQQIVQDFDIL